MMCARNNEVISITLDGEKLFNYLGSTVTEDGRSKGKIVYRICQAKSLLNSSDVSFSELHPNIWVEFRIIRL